jgi:hypothetical protein
MNKSLLTIAALFIATLPYTAHAQGTIRGAEEGAAAGDRAAGPLGAIVGGTIGAATGTVGGILGVEERPALSRIRHSRAPSLVSVRRGGAHRLEKAGRGSIR